MVWPICIKLVPAWLDLGIKIQTFFRTVLSVRFCRHYCLLQSWCCTLTRELLKIARMAFVIGNHYWSIDTLLPLKKKNELWLGREEEGSFSRKTWVMTKRNDQQCIIIALGKTIFPNGPIIAIARCQHVLNVWLSAKPHLVSSEKNLFRSCTAWSVIGLRCFRRWIQMQELGTQEQ